MELDFWCYYATPRDINFFSDLSARERLAKFNIIKNGLLSLVLRHATIVIVELTEELEGRIPIARIPAEKIASRVWQFEVNEGMFEFIWPLLSDCLEWPERRIVAFLINAPSSEVRSFQSLWCAPGRLRNPRVPLGRMFNIITKRIAFDQQAIVFDRVSISQFLLISRAEDVRPDA